MGPIVGGAFAVFLPVIGIALLLWHLAGNLVEVAMDAAEASVRVLQPAWQPGLAFLSRRKAGSGRSGRRRKRTSGPIS